MLFSLSSYVTLRLTSDGPKCLYTEVFALTKAFAPAQFRPTFNLQVNPILTVSKQLYQLAVDFRTARILFLNI